MISSLSSARLSHPSPSPFAHLPGLRITFALAGGVDDVNDIKIVDEIICEIDCSIRLLVGGGPGAVCWGVLLNANTVDMDSARMMSSDRSITNNKL